jgi:hypothetical protein
LRENGLQKMWITPKKGEATFIHTIMGQGIKFRHYKYIKCKGESPAWRKENLPS